MIDLHRIAFICHVIAQLLAINRRPYHQLPISLLFTRIVMDLDHLLTKHFEYENKKMIDPFAADNKITAMHNHY